MSDNGNTSSDSIESDVVNKTNDKDKERSEQLDTFNRGNMRPLFVPDSTNSSLGQRGSGPINEDDSGNSPSGKPRYSPHSVCNLLRDTELIRVPAIKATDLPNWPPATCLDQPSTSAQAIDIRASRQSSHMEQPSSFVPSTSQAVYSPSVNPTSNVGLSNVQCIDNNNYLPPTHSIEPVESGVSGQRTILFESNPIVNGQHTRKASNNGVSSEKRSRLDNDYPKTQTASPAFYPPSEQFQSESLRKIHDFMNAVKQTRKNQSYEKQTRDKQTREKPLENPTNVSEIDMLSQSQSSQTGGQWQQTVEQRPQLVEPLRQGHLIPTAEQQMAPTQQQQMAPAQQLQQIQSMQPMHLVPQLHFVQQLLPPQQVQPLHHMNPVHRFQPVQHLQQGDQYQPMEQFQPAQPFPQVPHYQPAQQFQPVHRSQSGQYMQALPPFHQFAQFNTQPMHNTEDSVQQFHQNGESEGMSQQSEEKRHEEQHQQCLQQQQLQQHQLQQRLHQQQFEQQHRFLAIQYPTYAQAQRWHLSPPQSQIAHQVPVMHPQPMQAEAIHQQAPMNPVNQSTNRQNEPQPNSPDDNANIYHVQPVLCQTYPSMELVEQLNSKQCWQNYPICDVPIPSAPLSYCQLIDRVCHLEDQLQELTIDLKNLQFQDDSLVNVLEQIKSLDKMQNRRVNRLTKLAKKLNIPKDEIFNVKSNDNTDDERKESPSDVRIRNLTNCQIAPSDQINVEMENWYEESCSSKRFDQKHRDDNIKNSLSEILTSNSTDRQPSASAQPQKQPQDEGPTLKQGNDHQSKRHYYNRRSKSSTKTGGNHLIREKQRNHYDNQYADNISPLNNSESTKFQSKQSGISPLLPVHSIGNLNACRKGEIKQRIWENQTVSNQIQYKPHPEMANESDTSNSKGERNRSVKGIMTPHQKEENREVRQQQPVKKFKKRFARKKNNSENIPPLESEENMPKKRN